MSRKKIITKIYFLDQWRKFRKETTSEISLSFDRKSPKRPLLQRAQSMNSYARQAKKSDKIPSTFVTHVVLRS